MEEVKYRIWDTKKKKMFYSYDNYLKLEGDLWSLWYKDDEGKLRLLTNSNDGFLMQLTGLKDKNGKEIYEGDIVKKWDWNKNRGIGDLIDVGLQLVIWDNHWGFILKNIQNKKIGYVGSGALENIEVIGNKWENPELLK